VKLCTLVSAGWRWALKTAQEGSGETPVSCWLCTARKCNPGYCVPGGSTGQPQPAVSLQQLFAAVRARLVNCMVVALPMPRESSVLIRSGLEFS
jgi:hypothetical protein